MASDFSLLIENASRLIEKEAIGHLFVGVDECFNRSEIKLLVSKLLNEGLARSSNSLWVEQRLLDDGSILHAYGGLSKKDKSSMVLLDGNIGNPVKHASFEDLQVVDYLITHFFSYGKIVLLTENTKNNQNGLRRILNEQIQPALAKHHSNKLCLTALFKRGKTSIDDYCSKVYEVLKKSDLNIGYEQTFI